MAATDANSGGAGDAATAQPKALILDLDMRPWQTWSPLQQVLGELGFAAEYRRFFPHVVASDRAAYQWIVVAGGAGPAQPTELLRGSDVAQLSQFVQSGGLLTLAARNGWQDSGRGDVDLAAMNALLDQLQVPVRIGRNTLVGWVAAGEGKKPPLHPATAGSYPSTLEWTLDWPLAVPVAGAPLPADLAPFALGVAPALQCAGQDLELLAATTPDVILWQTQGNSDQKITLPNKALPLAVLAKNAGTVLVLPRSLLTMTTSTGDASDKPILDLKQLDATAAMARALLARQAAVAKDPKVFAPNGCQSGPSPLPKPAPPLWPGAKSLPDAGSQLPVPPPFAPPLVQTAPPPANPDVPPAWFVNGRARMGWLSQLPKPQMAATMAFAKARGIDPFIVGVDAQVLALQADSTATAPSGVLADLADAATSTGTTVLLQTGWKGLLGAKNGALVGAHGQTLEAPGPLEAAFWQKSVAPVLRGAARVRSWVPAVAGVLVDTELYGSSALTVAQGMAFDAAAWQLLSAELAKHDSSLAAQAQAVPASQRWLWLGERGLWQFHLDALQAAVAGYAAQAAGEARQIAPDLQLAMYMPLLDDGWYARGLWQGWGTAERPVLALSYDAATHPLCKGLRADGLHVWCVAGLLINRLAASDASAAVQGCGLRADGWWMFQVTDVPASDSVTVPDNLNGAPGVYWAGIKAGNKVLAWTQD